MTKRAFILLSLAFHGFYSQSQKEFYLPDSVWMIPTGNDFASDTSEYSFARKAETDNIVALWARKFGDDPLINSDSIMRFDINDAMAELERFYDFYVNRLKFVDKGNSVTDKYKCVAIIFGQDDGTAYGGGEGKVGVLWTSPLRMNRKPYGALAHELGHSFQYLVNQDGAWGFTSSPEGSHGHSIFEMTSQYMLWQVYPEWMTFENYHLVDFMKQTHLAFLHEKNMYHSPYVLEYWSHKHGIEFVGKLWREAKEEEDPVIAYQRITGISQDEFNSEIFDAARKFVTWDLDRIREVAKPYANQHFTLMDSIGDGWYRIVQEKCPQNYGYNAIKLDIPKSKRKIKLEFEGLSDVEGYRSINSGYAGWRYGFVAVSETDKPTYGEMYTARQSSMKFRIPDDTKFLWLIVSGAPNVHWQHLLDGTDENDEQWPYQIRITGTKIDTDMIKNEEKSSTKSASK